MCWKSKIVYRIQCAREPCSGGGEEGGETEPTPTYVGETCRTLHARGAEHIDNYIKKKETSFMWRHVKEKHRGVIVSATKDFKFNVIESHRDSLNRVLGEAVHIQAMTADPKMLSMNSRNEYFTPQMVRPIFVKGPEE